MTNGAPEVFRQIGTAIVALVYISPLREGAGGSLDRILLVQLKHAQAAHTSPPASSNRSEGIVP